MILQLFNEATRRVAFAFISKYIRPELLMAGMYFILWTDPMFMGERTMHGMIWGMYMEFVLAHAHTGTAVVSFVFPPSGTSGKVAVALISLLYLVFVAGISLAIGSWLSAFLFLILSIKRVTMPVQNTNFLKEAFYAFFKIMILLLSAGLGFLIAKVFPADIPNLFKQKGNESIPAWGVCYFVALYLYENKVAKMFPRQENLD